MKIYTRTGDKGQTALFGGRRVSKTHARVMAYGVIDELNSQLGLNVAELRALGAPSSHDEEIRWLLQVQRDLFALGSWLASPEASERAATGQEAFTGARQARTHVEEARVSELEADIDRWESGLPTMKSFILPGGTLPAAQVHVTRAICRRAERETILLQESGEVVPALVLQYLNRLADALFVFARHLNAKAGVKEEAWV